MALPRRLTADQARRVVLGAQGFGRSRPTGRVDRRHIRRVFDDVGIVQIDSVSVLVRSHYLPFFSRLGPYDRSIVEQMAATHHEIVEYWFHMASWAPAATWPRFSWRAGSMSNNWHKWLREPGVADYVAEVRGMVADRAPVTANELEERSRPKEPWWDWSQAKTALEYLFMHGEVAAKRRSNFEREYHRLDDLLPADVLAEHRDLDPAEARRRCLIDAARHIGVGTDKDLTDYPRMNLTVARGHIAELVAAGRLVEVDVDGWSDPAYALPEATLPRSITARALLSPFDSVVWDRDRAERVFDFHYRIEIYVPKPKRVHGYYVLPFLLGDRLVGRVDLKADRSTGRLLVLGSFAEPGNDPSYVAAELAEELRDLAGWLDLEAVVVAPNGDLARPLRALFG